ncbi:MAG: YncE family protein, partial [Rhodothermales bacterium]
MSSPKRNRRWVKPGIALATGLVVVLLGGHRLADQHVRRVMGGPRAPVACLSCHVYMTGDNILQRLLEEDYLSPRDLAVSPDGNRLYVVAEEAEALLIVSATEGTVLNRIALGKHPHSIVLSRDGQTAYVSNRWSDNVSVIDLSKGRVIRFLPTGNGPAGIALGPGGNYLYVANSYSDDLSVIDLESGREKKRLAAGNNPYAVRLSPDGQSLFVTNRLSNPVAFRAPPVSEVTVVDTRSLRVTDRKAVPSAQMLESVDFAPEGDLALVTLARPKNLLPASQVRRGWMFTYGLGLVEPGEEGRVVQLLLDEVNAYFADPYDVVVMPDGRKAFVTHAGANSISVVDMAALRAVLDRATPDSLALFANHLGLSSQYVIKRIPTGANPQRLALAPDGRRLYVAERLEDRIAVIDTDVLDTVQIIDLGGPKQVSTLRLGERLFHQARAFQGQFSCRSCHPDGDQDALSWDFGGDGVGRNIVNTMTLRDIGETAPFKWAGTNVSLYMQDGIRFAKFLTRVEPFSPKELRAV